MLSQLSIRDIVLIDKLDIDFKSGLCALTGETGAGKSILLDALSLAIGRRTDRAALRQGASQGSVTAVFEPPKRHGVRAFLAENGVDAADEIILRRTVSAEGRTRAFVNDQAVSVGLLRDIGEMLVEVHGQHDERGLLSAAAHRALLDAYGGHNAESKACAEAHARLRAAEDEEAALARLVEAAAAEADFLRHAVKELEALKPEPGEDERLAGERSLLMSGEKIASELAAVAELLGGDDRAVDTRLANALRRLERLAPQAQGRLDEALAALMRAASEAAEARAQAESALERLQFDPHRLESIEERLFALRDAARKYRVQVDDLPRLKADVVAKADALADADTRRKTLAKVTAEARAAYRAATSALTAKRKAAAKKLEADVAREFKPLKLDKARFAVSITPLADGDAGAAGADRVEFMIATNAGADLGALTRIASGGELARVILALKVALAGQGTAPTLVFDEVDQGVGGAVADAVGTRLAKLGRQAQIVVVTHSPQVAARATHHWRIAKKSSASSATTSVSELDRDGRREEIARMLSGATVTAEARAAADILLNGAEAA